MAERTFSMHESGVEVVYEQSPTVAHIQYGFSALWTIPSGEFIRHPTGESRMSVRRLLPVGLAVVGVAAIVFGIFQGLVHVAPGYEGTITTGWGGELNHEERLFVQLGVVGIAGAVATLRWRRLAVVPAAMGAIVSFYAVRAVVHYVLDPGLYTEVSRYGGEPVVLVLGAEPFLLLLGGALLVAAGIVGWSAHATPPRDDAVSRTSPAE